MRRPSTEASGGGVTLKLCPRCVRPYLGGELGSRGAGRGADADQAALRGRYPPEHRAGESGGHGGGLRGQAEPYYSPLYQRPRKFPTMC